MQKWEKLLPEMEVDIRKGANHVGSLGVLRLCDLVSYYFRLRVGGGEPEENEER